MAATAALSAAQDRGERLRRRELAHDVGQVRDLIEKAEGDEAVRHVYPTVQAAVDSVRHSNDADR
jgi:hypothetical protein